MLEEKAQDPSSTLSILLGAEMRPLNWCPPETMYIQSADKKVVANNPAQLAMFCETMTTAASPEPATATKDLVLIAVARTKTVELMISPSGNFYVNGLPFKSKSLLQMLKEKGLRLE